MKSLFCVVMLTVLFGACYQEDERLLYMAPDAGVMTIVDVATTPDAGVTSDAAVSDAAIGDASADDATTNDSAVSDAGFRVDWPINVWTGAEAGTDLDDLVNAISDASQDVYEFILADSCWTGWESSRQDSCSEDAPHAVDVISFHIYTTCNLDGVSGVIKTISEGEVMTTASAVALSNPPLARWYNQLGPNSKWYELQFNNDFSFVTASDAEVLSLGPTGCLAGQQLWIHVGGVYENGEQSVGSSIMRKYIY